MVYEHGGLTENTDGPRRISDFQFVVYEIQNSTTKLKIWPVL